MRALEKAGFRIARQGKHIVMLLRYASCSIGGSNETRSRKWPRRAGLIERDPVRYNATVHLRVDGVQVVHLERPLPQDVHRGCPRRPECVVCEEAIAIEEVYLAYRRLRNEVEHVGARAADAHKSRSSGSAGLRCGGSASLAR